jgi:hypothetical protein
MLIMNRFRNHGVEDEHDSATCCLQREVPTLSTTVADTDRVGIAESRFQQWVREGKLVEVLRLLAKHLHERGKLNLDEAFVDATFASAKKGASRLAPPGAARAPRSSLSPLVTVFLSPSLSKALRRPSASLWKLFWPDASSTRCPND